MKTYKIITVLVISILLISSVGCSKVENMYEKFSPEILYKRLVMGTGGSSSWQVSPDAMEITLEPGVSEWTVRARVSAPNGLRSIQLMKVDGEKEQVLETYSEFTESSNAYEVAYTVTGITSQTVIRIRAADNIGNQSVKGFVVKVQK